MIIQYLYSDQNLFSNSSNCSQNDLSLVSWGWRICQLHLCREEKAYPPTSVLNMILNHVMVKPESRNLGECRIPLHCHYSRIYL